MERPSLALTVLSFARDYRDAGGVRVPEVTLDGLSAAGLLDYVEHLDITGFPRAEQRGRLHPPGQDRSARGGSTAQPAEQTAGPERLAVKGYSGTVHRLSEMDTYEGHVAAVKDMKPQDAERLARERGTTRFLRIVTAVLLAAVLVAWLAAPLRSAHKAPAAHRTAKESTR